MSHRDKWEPTFTFNNLSTPLLLGLGHMIIGTFQRMLADPDLPPAEREMLERMLGASAQRLTVAVEDHQIVWDHRTVRGAASVDPMVAALAAYVLAWRSCRNAVALYVGLERGTSTTVARDLQRQCFPRVKPLGFLDAGEIPAVLTLATERLNFVRSSEVALTYSRHGGLAMLESLERAHTTFARAVGVGLSASIAPAPVAPTTKSEVAVERTRAALTDFVRRSFAYADPDREGSAAIAERLQQPLNTVSPTRTYKPRSAKLKTPGQVAKTPTAEAPAAETPAAAPTVENSAAARKLSVVPPANESDAASATGTDA